MPRIMASDGSSRDVDRADEEAPQQMDENAGERERGAAGVAPHEAQSRHGRDQDPGEPEREEQTKRAPREPEWPGEIRQDRAGPQEREQNAVREMRGEPEEPG